MGTYNVSAIKITVGKYNPKALVRSNLEHAVFVLGVQYKGASKSNGVKTLSVNYYYYPRQGGFSYLN